MAPSNPPRDHHYIPQFVLREWAVDAGKLWRYSKPVPNKLAAKRVSTGAIGFESFLYEVPGETPDKAQQVETRFMSSVDQSAARAHQILLGNKDWSWTSVTRSGWSRFILSLWMRTPASVQAYKAAIASLWGTTVPEIAAKYAELRKPEDPERFEDHMIARDPRIVEKVAMYLLQKSIDHAKVGERINNMKWTTLTLADASIDFLISDSPVISTNGLAGKDALIVMPVSPRRAFIAFNHDSTFETLQRMRELDFVKHSNKLVVQRARHFVGAARDDQRKFVAKHFGTAPVPTITELIAHKYSEDAAALETAISGS